jgi:hypothetical protein
MNASLGISSSFQNSVMNEKLALSVPSGIISHYTI